MRGTSLASREAVLESFVAVLGESGSEAVTYGQQLFAAVDLLDAHGALRRALTDPARDGAAKRALIAQIFGPHAAEAVVTVLGDAASRRWSRADDLTESVERFAATAVLVGAKNDGRLEEVSQELWFASQALTGQIEIRTALTDSRASADARADLVGSLFEGKVSDEAMVLIRRAAAAPRGRHIVPLLQHFSDLGATLRQRKVAHVTVGAPLSADQIAKIGRLLERNYNQHIQLDVTVDRRIVGGIRIQVGAEVLDQTLLARLAEVRQKIAS